MCDPALNTLALSLPYAHCSQSRLVCHMSGTALNENNQPMMLPNGKSVETACFFRSSHHVLCRLCLWREGSGVAGPPERGTGGVVHCLLLWELYCTVS